MWLSVWSLLAGVLEVYLIIETDTYTTMRTITIITALIFVTLQTLQAQKTIDLRLNPVSQGESNKSLYVDVEVRYNQVGVFNLAGQNFRLYYNAESLHLNTEQSSSRLPENKYSKLNIVDNFEGIAADDVNQLDFDDNLGFVNVSIDLEANQNGGISIQKSDEWVTVARLKFDVKETKDAFQVVWGRDGMTDQYATAFVEVSEWIEPNYIKSAEIEYYEDMVIENSEKIVNHPLVIAVGPNPATEFVQISFETALDENAEITIRDLTGRMIKNTTIRDGEKSIRMDITDLSASSYFLEIYSENMGSIHQEKLVVAK